MTQISKVEMKKNKLMADHEICVVTYPSWTRKGGYSATIHKQYVNATAQCELLGENETDVVDQAVAWVEKNLEIL